jgi:hypothetical protein
MGKNEWLVPPEFLHQLGEFDLCPCSPIDRPWSFAKKHYTIKDDGLSLPWEGRVWMNPPYGEHAARWLEKLYYHGNGIALIFARTETHMFFNWVWDRADAVLFIKGRLFFYHNTGVQAKANAGAPSVLVAYGKENVGVLKNTTIKGKFVPLKDIKDETRDT